jgi:hypothetical protein
MMAKGELGTPAHGHRAALVRPIQRHDPRE